MIRAPEADAYFAGTPPGVRGLPLATKLLHGCLFLAILVSPFVFIEPSPYEAATGLLAIACLVDGVRMDRKILPLLILLLLFNLGTLMTLPQFVQDSEVVTYVAISFYLAMTTIVFACLFADDSLRRFEIMRRAYIIAAVIACVAGIAGYFGYWPEGELYGRARATFKDPNVFGPFLILPLLLLIQSLFFRGIRLYRLALFGLIAFGLLLSFSRGAWAHFFVSATFMMALTFLTSPGGRTRLRLIVLSLVSLLALGAFLGVALSFESVSDVFAKRAKLTQSYDVRSGGRFDLQRKAVEAVLENPGGLGPHGFERTYGGQQHNVYLQAFLVYGWLGGFAYVIVVLLTLLIGLRLCFVATPWQSYLIASLAAFVGEVGESFIIDTDHWRHFWLLMGLVWGLSVASINATRRRRQLA